MDDQVVFTSTIILLIVVYVVSWLVGYLIWKVRWRGWLWFFLWFILWFLGWIIMLCLPKTDKKMLEDLKKEKYLKKVAELE